jgi:hypothetical protein
MKNLLINPQQVSLSFALLSLRGKQMKVMWIPVLMLSMVAIAPVIIAQEKQSPEALETVDTSAENVDAELELDAKEWGIRNGCISRSRIKSIRWVDDQSAIVRMMGKKKVLLTLAKECRGIKRHGYMSKVKGNQLCERFDRFEVLEFGTLCTVASLEPYVELPVSAEDSAY